MLAVIFLCRKLRKGEKIKSIFVKNKLDGKQGGSFWNSQY